MNRLAPLSLDQVPAPARAAIDAGAKLMGFIPNDALVMARNPPLLAAFLELVRSVYGPGKVAPDLKRLVGMAASRAANCHYCTAHTANSARALGVSVDKLNALCDFAVSDAFSDAEKAALHIASEAAKVPNGVDDDAYRQFAHYFGEDQQVEIMAVISLFGFLNRWNATLDTQLENIPADNWRELNV
ncbi:MAG: carboxymuconolactone decarboxylase family protein [Gammaproteobacteria bacterium]